MSAWNQETELPEDLTLESAIDFAVTTEQLGERIYTKLAKHFKDDPELSELFGKLAADEQHHGNKFGKLKEKVAGRELNYEQQLYLKAFSISSVFSDEKSPNKNVDTITTREDALERAFNLEKTTLQYYKAMKEIIDDPIVDEMIAEEKSHLTQVMKYMVSGAKMRGLGDKQP